MNSKRIVLAGLFLAIGVVCAGIIIGHRLNLQNAKLSSLWLLAAITFPLLVLLGFLPFVLRPIRAPPSKRLTRTGSTIMTATTILVSTISVIGVWSGHLWLMSFGVLFLPLASMLVAPSGEKGMKRGQFSLRKIFVLMTCFAVAFCATLAIERWRDDANRRMRINTIAANRAMWESHRGNLPPGVYEQKMKELDDEAAGLQSQ